MPDSSRASLLVEVFGSLRPLRYCERRLEDSGTVDGGRRMWWAWSDESTPSRCETPCKVHRWFEIHLFLGCPSCDAVNDALALVLSRALGTICILRILSRRSIEVTKLLQRGGWLSIPFEAENVSSPNSVGRAPGAGPPGDGVSTGRPW